MSARCRPARRAPARAPCSRPCPARCRARCRRDGRRVRPRRQRAGAGRCAARGRSRGSSRGRRRDEDVLGLEIAMDDAACRARRPGRARSAAAIVDAPCARAVRPAPSRSRSVSPSSSSITAYVSCRAVERCWPAMGRDRSRRWRGCWDATARRRPAPPARNAPSASGSSATDRRQDLDRDVATEPRVPRAVDLAHAAGAERREIS